MGSEQKRAMVAIVGDEKLRSLLKDFLNEEQFETQAPPTGREAFHQLAKRYFDIILTDYQMPGLGGVDLLPRLKRIQPWARIIVIPTKRASRRERKIIESAADVCLEKPFPIERLKMALERLLSPGGIDRIEGTEGWKSERLSVEVG